MSDLDVFTSRDSVDVEIVVREIAPSLLAYFVRRVRPQEDAADCLSETLLAVWRRRDDMPLVADEARAWCFGIARRVLANQRRSVGRRSALADRLRSEIVELSSTDADIDPELTAALAGLGAKDYELVTLIVWDGLGVAEAGRLLGMRPDAARARYSRARRKLREQL